MYKKYIMWSKKKIFTILKITEYSNANDYYRIVHFVELCRDSNSNLIGHNFYFR